MLRERNKQVISLFIVLVMVGIPVVTAVDGATSAPKLFSQAQLGVTEFSDNILISVNDASYPHHVEPTLAISDGGTLFAGWKNANYSNSGGVRVSFSRSSDGGATWTTPIDMPMFNNSKSRQSDPWLLWHEDMLYYAYLEFGTTSPPENESFSQITVAHSSDNGSTWVPVRASFGQYFADKETMAISENGTIYVAYDDVDTTETDTGTTVRCTKSTDGGNTFKNISVVANAYQGNVGPYITTHNDETFVAYTSLSWPKGNIVLKRSSDGARTWQDLGLVNNDGNYSYFRVVEGHPSKLTLPVIKFDKNNRLYILWADTFNADDESFDVYLRYSDDLGATWSDRIRINPNVEGDQWEPDMDIDSNGRVHIVYYDEQGDSYRLYYRVVEFTGTQHDQPVLGDPIPVADVSTSNTFTRPGDYCTIRLDSEDVPHVVWSDGRNGEMDIYYAHGVYGSGETTTTTTPPTPQNIDMTVVITIISIVAIVIILVYIVRRRS